VRKSLFALAVLGALGAMQAARADTTVQLYGHLDLSVDDVDNGLSGRTGIAPNSKTGWLPAVSSNLSRVGLRGYHDLGAGLKAVMQVETQIDVAATPGTTSDQRVQGAFASRNSFLGLAGGWGAIKLGKTDAPYKLSTGRMDPFSATIGDYNSIMGNTGGDNRAEFDWRLSHAVWYESPDWSGFRVNALMSPGQNRSTDNSINAEGEPNCTGGNSEPCGDGSFGNAYSIAGIYANGPLYVTAAWELHHNVNRTGDELGAGGGTVPPVGSVGIADEDAWKIGAQYKFATKTTLNAIYEHMHRAAPDDTYNERSRNGYWLAATQKVTEQDDINLGWARADKSPGNPGSGLLSDPTAANFGSSIDNASNMYALGYKHHFADKQTTWYAVYAVQDNHSGGHYDLGASGHGITTDCHDAAGVCFAGNKIQGVSVGMTYNF